MRHCALTVWCSTLLLCCPAFADYGQSVQYFPQAVAGGGAVTVFSVHNPGATDARVRLQLFDPDGVQFHSSEVVIPDGGVQTISVGQGQTQMKVGWARITAVTGSFEATEFFQLSVGTQALPRVGVLPCNASSEMKFFAYLTGATTTGLAVANPSDTSNATVTLRRYNTLGVLGGTVSTTLQPHRQLARFLNEDPWFEGLTSFEGIVEVESTQPIVLVMLRSDNSMLSSAAVLNPYIANLTPGSITTEYIAGGAVTSDKIFNGTIQTVDLANESVTQGKLDATNTGTAGQVLGTDGSNLKWQPDSLTLPFKFEGNWPDPSGWTPGIYLKTDNALAFVIDIPSSNTSMAGAAASIYVQDTYLPGLIVDDELHIAVSGRSTASIGVEGISENSYGLDAYSQNKAGIRSQCPNGDGIMTSSEAPFKSGIYAVNGNASGYAGFFAGRVGVTGELTKGSGAFKIDHPLDPENKYLYHSFVESPDMKNVYDGVATLDAIGEAWVELPDWFEALNRDFRYQLTPLGGAAPELHVASEIQQNTFLIRGGAPGMRVSWQVTGIRQDAFANANRIPVEEAKPVAERGTYLHPQAFGQSVDKSVERIYHPAAFEKSHRESPEKRTPR